MFGLLSKKKYKIKCPICEFDYNFKLNPKDVTEFDYPHFSSNTKKSSKLADYKCEFCKSEMTILMLNNGYVISINEKWEIIENNYNDKTDEIIEKITESENLLDEQEKPEKKEKIQNKIDKLKKQLDRIEDVYANKEERHDDKKDRWQEKLENRK